MTHKALRLRGCGRVALSLVGVIAVTTVTLVPAEAKHYRARVVSHGGSSHEQESSSPRYAAIVVDANSGNVLHAAAADELRHPASLTKIMTLYLLFERLEAGKLKLDTELPVSEHASVQAPTKLGLKPGHTIAVDDAIRGLVTKSANDAAVVVAEALGGTESDFAEMMTRKAHALGMSRTEYHNASGLPNDAQVTTARDQALLGRAIQERFPRYYRYFSTQSFTYHGETMGNHNHLLGHVEGVDGIKTGYTQASGFNLVTSVHRNNRHIVAVVLGGTSGGARDARMRSLIEEYITTASSQHSAPVIAENATAKSATRTAEAKSETAKSESTKSETTRQATAKRETAKSGGTYEVASVPQQIPAPDQTSAPQQNWPASKFAAAHRDATAATSKVAAVAADDTIKPIPVKTIKVKLTQMQTAGLGPIITVETPAAAPTAAAPVAQPVVKPVAPPVAAAPPVVPAPVAAEPVAPAPTPAARTVMAAAEPIVATPVKAQAPAAKPAAMTLASAASVPVATALAVATPVAPAPVATPVAAAPVATPVAPPAPMATQVAPPVAPVATAAATERVFPATPAFRATKVPVSVAGLTQNNAPPSESIVAETAAPEPAAPTPVAAPVQKTPPAKTIATAPPALPAVEAAAPVVETSAPEAKAVATARTMPPRGWIIQIGAFDAEHDAQQRLNIAHAKIGHVLDRADPFTEPVVKGEKTLYRARFAGFQQKDEAEAVCKQLKRNDIDCMTIKN